MAYLSFPDLQIRVARSANGGSSWNDVLVYQEAEMADKPHLMVDNVPGSSRYGSIYVAWRHRVNPQGILFSHSTDGENWSTPAQISGTSSEPAQGANIQVGPDGDVYVVWGRFAGENAWEAESYWLTKSTNGGSSFATPTLVVDDLDLGTSNLPNISPLVRINNLPSMAIDVSGGPQDGAVYLVWAQANGSQNGLDILLTQVPEESGAFSKAPPGSRVNQDSTSRSQWLPWMAVDQTNGDLGVVFFDRRHDSSNEEAKAFFAHSTDAGANWTERGLSDSWMPTQIRSEGNYMGDYMGIAAHNGTFFPCWYDNTSGNFLTYVAREQVSLFANRSSDTNFDYTGDPYAALVFDYDGDGDEDMVLTDASNFAGLMERTDNSQTSDVPKLLDQAGSEFSVGSRPRDNRGAITADYDNDGDVDLFMSSRTAPRLYRNTGSSTTFEDVSSSAFTNFSSAADSSWAGAWGDYDRDGNLDLYIGRADGTSDEPTGPLHDLLLRNLGDGTFEDATWNTGLQYVTPTTTTAVSWADLTDDGELDVFVGGADSGEMSLLLEQELSTDPEDPVTPTTHTFESASNRLPSSTTTLDEIVGATWHDLDNDGDLDLLLAGTTTGENGTRVLWNNGSGSLTLTTTIDGGIAAQGQAVLDLDLDGGPDLLLAPTSSSLTPSLYRNEKDDVPPTFTDVSLAAGMASRSATAFRAVAATDLAGPSNTPDGDQDVYLGRPSEADEFFYQNAVSGVDVPASRWLKIALQSDRSNNAQGKGAVVKVETTLPSTQDLVQTQIVDGGSGVGSQAAPVLTFGLANTTDDVDVTVTWPDGYQTIRTVSADSLETTLVIADDHGPGLVGSTVGAFALIRPDENSDWVFEWETDRVCDPSLTRVKISGTGGRNCEGPDFSTPVTLGPNTSGVDVEMHAKPGGGYVHRLIWRNQPCGIECTYDYQIRSGVNDSGDPGTTQWSSWTQFSLSVCIN